MNPLPPHEAGHDRWMHKCPTSSPHQQSARLRRSQRLRCACMPFLAVQSGRTQDALTKGQAGSGCPATHLKHAHTYARTAHLMAEGDTMQSRGSATKLPAFEPACTAAGASGRTQKPALPLAPHARSTAPTVTLKVATFIASMVCAPQVLMQTVCTCLTGPGQVAATQTQTDTTAAGPHTHTRVAFHLQRLTGCMQVSHHAGKQDTVSVWERATHCCATPEASSCSPLEALPATVARHAVSAQVDASKTCVQ